MERISLNARIAMAVLGVVLIIVSFVFFLRFLKPMDYDSETIYLYDGWTVTVNDEVVLEDGSLKDFRFDRMLKKDDIVTMSCTLPSNVKQVSMLRLLIYLSVVNVNVDDELVYVYGADLRHEDALLGSGYHFVQLPMSSAGKQLSVTYFVGENAAFTNLPTPEISQTKSTYYKFAAEHMTSIFSSYFLLMLGVIVTCLAVVATSFSREYLQLIYIGLFSLDIGIWSICNTKIIEIFNTNLASNTALEYMSLYIAPIPLMALICHLRENISETKKKLIYSAIAAVAAFAIITAILNYTNICHYPKSVTLFHIIGVFCLIVGAFACYDKKRNYDMSNRILLLAILVFMIFALFDVLRFNFQKYLFPDAKGLELSILPLGTLVFVVMLMVSYIIHMYSMVMERKERDILTTMAYQDNLTMLYNRAKAEEIFKHLDEDDVEYTIINMDLNGLKRINDSLGHAKGDELITTFAKILRECFEDIGTVIRMGGDEFIVVVEGKGRRLVTEAVRNLVLKEKAISISLEYDVEASYGIAAYDEVDSMKAENVYALADERMYKMKIESHKARL